MAPPVHGPYHLCRTEAGDGRRAFEAEAPFAFRELVPSWNVSAPPGSGFVVELRVRGAGGWSPWWLVDAWRERAQGLATTADERSFPAALDVDTLVSEVDLWQAELRVRAAPGCDGRVRVERVAFCFTRGGWQPGPAGGAPRPVTALAVPFRSQRDEAPALAPRLCSPTSLAMVLAYRGVRVPTAEVAARAYDRRHDLYGNWPRTIQTAFTYGCPGYVTRFATWDEVRRSLAAGQPLVASIRVEPGDLVGAPFPSSEGHLIVLRGIDRQGDVLVSDPAFGSAAEGETTYRRADLERVWLWRRKGTAYVILPREAGT